jgi:hypothetical protein
VASSSLGPWRSATHPAARPAPPFAATSLPTPCIFIVFLSSSPIHTRPCFLVFSLPALPPPPLPLPQAAAGDSPYELALAPPWPQIGATPPHLTPRTNLALNYEPSSRNFNLSPILEFFLIVKGNEKLILLGES